MSATELPPRDRALAASDLRRRCAPEQFQFRTTDELEDYSEALGQARAAEAIRFGIGMARDGYNIFAMGPEGLGRRTMVRRLLESQAAGAAAERARLTFESLPQGAQARSFRVTRGTFLGTLLEAAAEADLVLASPFPPGRSRAGGAPALVVLGAESQTPDALVALGDMARSRNLALDLVLLGGGDERVVSALRDPVRVFLASDLGEMEQILRELMRKTQAGGRQR